MMDGKCQSVWDSCLQIISSRVKPQSYTTWFSQTKGAGAEGETFTIAAPNKFVLEWLEEHYFDLISEVLLATTGQSFGIKFCISPDGGDEQEKVLLPIKTNYVDKDRKIIDKYAQASNLSGRFLFDSFVVGESNRFAHAAAMAVAEAPGKTRYNPLFIYGRSGLGKTHLAQAIGNFVKDIYPNIKILYITSEKFTSDFINSITSSSTNDFMHFYRNVDILLLDDIQFLTGKESTQVQFFHTFNVLYQTGRQIVLTSDSSPKDIKGLEERLLSRFNWGLVTDIQPPDLETRIAILKKKSEGDGINIPENVLVYIAEHITNNIRELEGCLIRLIAFASLSGNPINLDIAVKILKDTIPELRKQMTIDMIQKKVSKALNIPENMLSAKKKTQELVNARNIAIFLSRKLTDSSLKTIGANFGGRDHSTIIHAINQVEERSGQDQAYKSRIDDIINSLYI